MTERTSARVAVDPQVKAVGRIGHALAFQHVQIVVHQQEVAGAHLVEAKPETRGPHGALGGPAGGDLPGQGRAMLFPRQHAAAQRELLAITPGGRLQVALHVRGCAGFEIGLGLVTGRHDDLRWGGYSGRGVRGRCRHIVHRIRTPWQGSFPGSLEHTHPRLTPRGGVSFPARVKEGLVTPRPDRKSMTNSLLNAGIDATRQHPLSSQEWPS